MFTHSHNFTIFLFLFLSVLTHPLTLPKHRDAGFFFQFEIYNIQSWALDHGSSLQNQESGCGAMTGWSWTDASSSGLAKVYFNLPLFLTSGCVERAIVSAGGPKISCQFGGAGYTSRRRQAAIDGGAANNPDEEMRRRDDEALAEAAFRRAAADESENENRKKMRKRGATTEGPTRPTPTATPTYLYTSTSTKPSYVPMTWDANNTVIMTWTLSSTGSVKTYTTTTTIPGYTYSSTPATSTSPSSSPSSSSSSSPSSSSSQHTTSTSATSGPTAVPTVGTYHLVGCYAEPSGGRAFPTLYANDSMTPALCLGAANGATYFGLEYGRECWYGNTIAAGAVLEATNKNCTKVCPGNAAQYCGGGSHLLVYHP
jgi:hypothetical protein